MHVAHAIPGSPRFSRGNMLTVQSRIAVLLSMALAVGAFAQVDTATITGRVSDPTGATVGGVQIKVVQIETNFQLPRSPIPRASIVSSPSYPARTRSPLKPPDSSALS